MDALKTSLSAGEIIRSLLMADPEVGRLTEGGGGVVPVMVNNSPLPYVVYRRAGMETTPNRGVRRCDSVAIEVLCFAEGYAQSVMLAEAVRRVLDSCEGAVCGELVMRSCHLTDSEEAWQDDAYVQQLTFTVKI